MIELLGLESKAVRIVAHDPQWASMYVPALEAAGYTYRGASGLPG